MNLNICDGGDGMAVREMAAVREVHPEDGVAGFHESEVDGDVGRGARERLDVRISCAEERFGALDGEGLHRIGELLSPVIALPGISFGIFIRENRPERFEDRLRDVILRRDELKALPLAPRFKFDEMLDACIIHRTLL
jgi:hypothetical protein